MRAVPFCHPPAAQPPLPASRQAPASSLAAPPPCPALPCLKHGHHLIIPAQLPDLTLCCTLSPPHATEDGTEEVKVTPDFDVEAVPLSQYYTHLDQRLSELQGLMGSTGAALPSTYEKYLHGNMPVGGSGNPLVSAKEYYEQLKQLRADSQARVLKLHVGVTPLVCCHQGGVYCQLIRGDQHRCLTAPSPPHLGTIPQQVYYPVASEVYRDLLWEARYGLNREFVRAAKHRLACRQPFHNTPPLSPQDVDMADPVEYTYCRYTPVTTEVGMVNLLQGHGADQQRPLQSIS